MESIVHDMRCPNCGSHAFEPDKSSFGIFVCTMCGSKLSAEYGNHKNRELSALFTKAFTELENKKFTDANQTFTKIVELDPSCSKGYWGRFLSDINTHHSILANNYDIVERFQIQMRSISGYDAKYNSLDDVHRALISGEITLEMLKNQSIPEIPIPELEDINLRLAYKFATSEERKYYDSVLTRTLELAFERESERKAARERAERERKENERVKKEKEEIERLKREENENKKVKEFVERRKDFQNHVMRYENTKDIRILEELENYFLNYGSNEYASKCRLKIEGIKSDRRSCLLIIIVSIVVFLLLRLLGKLIFGEDFGFALFIIIFIIICLCIS